MLAVVSGGTVVVALLAGFGVLVAWAPLVPAALVVAWLLVCRTQVARLEAARAARPLREVETTPAAYDAPVAPAAEEAPAEEAPVEQAAAETAAVAAQESAPPAPLVIEPDEDTVSLDAAALTAAMAEEMPRASTWDMQPITLPTYITKPRARRAVRRLDHDGDGVSSSARNAEDSRLVAASATGSVDERPAPQAVGS